MTFGKRSFLAILSLFLFASNLFADYGDKSYSLDIGFTYGFIQYPYDMNIVKSECWTGVSYQIRNKAAPTFRLNNTSQTLGIKKIRLTIQKPNLHFTTYYFFDGPSNDSSHSAYQHTNPAGLTPYVSPALWPLSQAGTTWTNYGATSNSIEITFTDRALSPGESFVFETRTIGVNGAPMFTPFTKLLWDKDGTGGLTDNLLVEVTYSDNSKLTAPLFDFPETASGTLSNAYYNTYGSWLNYYCDAKSINDYQGLYTFKQAVKLSTPTPYPSTPTPTPTAPPTPYPSTPTPTPTAPPTPYPSTPTPTPTVTPTPYPSTPTPTPLGRKDVFPYVKCVQDRYNGTFDAYFGYMNPNATTTVIPVGTDNKVLPGSLDQGQPEQFASGSVMMAFSTSFNENGSVSWMLDGSMATADKTSPACDAPAPVCFAIPGASSSYASECQGDTTTITLDGSDSYDPNGAPLTYAWSTSCPGSTLGSPDSVTTSLSLATSGNGEAVNCVATLLLNSASGTTSCQAPVTVAPCLVAECDELDIESYLFSIDGTALVLEDIIGKVVRKVKRKGSRRDKRFASAIEDAAHELALESWQDVWMIPVQIQSCPESVTQCASVSTTSTKNMIAENTVSLRKLVDRIVRRFRKITDSRKGNKYKKAADAQVDQTEQDLAAIPDTASVCN